MLNVAPHQGNTNQNYTEIPPHASQTGQNEPLRILQMLERMWKNGNPLALLATNWWQPLWKSVWRFLTKLKIDLPHDPAIALLGIYPRDTGVLMHRGNCTPMFIVALSTIVQLWKEPKRPSTYEWIKKMWFIYTMEYYMAMRKNDIWPFVATWMELKSVMVSEISHTEKDRYHMFPLLCGS